MAEEFTAKFKVDISDLKKNIQEANKEIKLANATFKAQTAGMDDWAKSADGLGKKLEQLKSNLESQNKILSSYKQNLERQQTAFEENGRKAEELKQRLQELADKGLNKNNEEYKKYQDALKAVLTEQDKNAKACDDLKLAILNQQGAVNKTEAEIKKYEKSLNTLKESERQAVEEANRQKTAYEQLKGTINNQQDMLNQLKREYAEIVVEQGKNSESAKDLAKQIDSLSTELKQNQIAIASADKSADELDKSLDDVGESAKVAEGGFTVLKGALAGLVVEGINVAINGMKKLATASYEAWNAYDDGVDAIIATTGATGDSAKELIDTYEAVSKSVIGNFSDIGLAIGEVKTRFNLTGDQLEETSRQFIKFAELNNTDVKSSIDSVQSAMASFGLSSDDVNSMLDTLNKVAQETGVSVSNVASAMMTNAPALRELGMNASDSAFFLANLSKNGVDASAVMTGLKKALVTASKEGKPMAEAMNEIEVAIKNASDSTDAIRIATDLFGSRTAPAIASAVRDSRLSFEQFGTALEDFQGNISETYEAMIDEPDKVTLAMQSLKVETASMFGEFINQYAPQIQEILSNFTNKVMPKIMDFAGWLINNLPTIASLITGITASMTAMFAVKKIFGIIDAFKKWKVATEGVTVAQKLLNVAQNASPIGLIVGLIAGVVTAFITLWHTSEDFRNFWIGLWEKIKNAVQVAWDYIGTAFTTAWTNIKATWSTVAEWFIGIWESIKNAFASVKDFFTEVFTSAKNAIVDTWHNVTDVFKEAWKEIKGVFEPVVTWFKQKFTDAYETIQTVWDNVAGWFEEKWIAIKDVFKAVKTYFGEKFGEAYSAIRNKIDPVIRFFADTWEGIKNIFMGVGEFFTETFEVVASAIKAPLNAVIRGLNKVIRGLNSIFGEITIPDWVPEYGGGTWSLHINEIPELAKGGVLKRGQVGLLEGSGAEAVVPLQNNKRWIRAVANDMLNELQGQIATSGITNANTETVTTNNFTQIINAPKQPSRIELYRQTRNLLEYAGTAGSV